MSVEAPNDEQKIERDFDEQSTDHDECSSESEGDIQQYDVTDFDRENMYQDESEYSYYHDKFQYYEENNSESDEELDEYSHPVQVDTNKNLDDLKHEGTNVPIENNDNGACGREDNPESYNQDQVKEEEDSNASENLNYRDEETEILPTPLRTEREVGNFK